MSTKNETPHGGEPAAKDPPKYKINRSFHFECGFKVSANHVLDAVQFTNEILLSLPSTLYRTLDYKTTSATIGAIFCDALANFTNAIVNPIEKGHPDIIPAKGKDASEETLRNYPEGIEVKCTIGNVQSGANLRAGEKRILRMTGITWQAHHTEVSQLMGLVWDFIQPKTDFEFPGVTGVFFSNSLIPSDWGKISGTTGRNTKVTGMTASGKRKMGVGWIILLENSEYLRKYAGLLSSTAF